MLWREPTTTFAFAGPFIANTLKDCQLAVWPERWLAARMGQWSKRRALAATISVARANGAL